MKKQETQKVSRSKNYIEANMGGDLRRVVVGMRVSEYLAEQMKTEGVSSNLYTRYIDVTYIGLQNKHNTLPEDFDKETVVEWLDEMEQSEWDNVKAFIDEAMGFIIVGYINSLERLTETMPEAPMQNLAENITKVVKAIS